MKKAINKLSAALLTAQFAFKKRLKNKLKDNRGGISEYALEIVIGVVLAGVIIAIAIALLKGEIKDGIVNKVNEFFSMS